MSDPLQGPKREMTLAEWVERLPSSHLARREFLDFRAQLAASVREADDLRARVEALAKWLEDTPRYTGAEAAKRLRNALGTSQTPA